MTRADRTWHTEQRDGRCFSVTRPIEGGTRRSAESQPLRCGVLGAPRACASQGLGGAILGSALVYIFPALMAIGETGGAMGKFEKGVNWALTALGIFFAGLGAVMCLK